MNADEWAEIHRANAGGETIKGIAERLGMSRNTVRRALKLTSPPDDHRGVRGSATDPFEEQIRELILADNDISIAEISRQLAWPRSRTLLARKVGHIRAQLSAQRPREHYTTDLGVPQPATSFVGRRAELGDLRGLLGEHRLISIVGPGGIGKTRLAIQSAEEFRRAFPDGVRFVDLTIARSGDLLAQTVCDLLGVDTRDSHTQAAEDSLVTFLRNRRMLLILDNCEHIVDSAAALAARLVEAAPNLRLLITSREFLSIPGEFVFHLAALPFDGHEKVSPAVELFTRRAAAVLTDFTLDDSNRDDVRRICRRLDGLPLAIELACTRLNLLSVRELADLLDRRMSLLTAVGSRDRTSRHRSLQATVDWSYELCNRSEQVLWSRLSVFVGGFDLQAAVEVCADDALPPEVVLDAAAGLVSKSVVLREDAGGQVRFRMLESIREYGASKLPEPDRARINAMLVRWCSRIIIDSAEHWFSAEQLAKATVVEQNRGSIRAALEHAASAPDDVSLTALVTRALGRARFLWACGISAREHRMWLIKALDMPHASTGDKTQIFGVLALLQTLQGDRDSAAFALQRARELAEAEGMVHAAAFVTHVDGLRDFFAGDFPTATAKFNAARSRYREQGADADLLAMLQIHRGMLLSSMMEIDAATEAFTEVHDATAAVGEQWYHSYATYGLGLVALLGKNPAEAVRLSKRALRGHRTFGDIIGLTLMSDLLGWALAAQGESDRATVVLGAASAMWGSIGQQLYGSEHWNALRENAVQRARADLGDSGFERRWSFGETLSVAELFGFVFDEAAIASAGGAQTDRDRQLAMLSAREQEVALLVVEGMTNRQVAERLVLSTRTVEGHVERILHKLNVGRRTQISGALRIDSNARE